MLHSLYCLKEKFTTGLINILWQIKETQKQGAITLVAGPNPEKNSKLKGFPDDRGPAAVSGAP